MAAEWTQATVCDNRLRFREFHLAHIDSPEDIYGQYLFNGRLYSKQFQGVPYAKQTHPGQGN